MRALKLAATTAVLLGLAGCALPGITPAAPATTAATPSPAATPTVSPTVAADRAVCIDLDARSGELYNVLVVPMMTGATGQKSIDVDVARLGRAVAAVKNVGQDSLPQASPEIADAGMRMVAAADALGLYAHADSTALLTAFVSLAAECQKAGHKPSWFDAAALASR